MSKDEDVQVTPHFRDLINSKSVIADNDHLPGADGTPGVGMKLSEALPLSAMWWDKVGRAQMPDFGKPVASVVIKSAILNGLPYARLDREERIRVLAQWYAHIGVKTIIEGRGTSQDKAKVDKFDKVREDGEKIFDVLGNDQTHTETSNEGEETTWQKEYDADKLVDENGIELKQGN